MTWDTNGLKLFVSLQNNGNEPVEFLYSFLEVRDQKGNLMTTLAEDLPQTIPADGKAYDGILEIPSSLSETLESLSLRLSNYPEETLTLELKNLAVPKSQ